MNILERILADKQREVTEKKSLYPVKLLEKSVYFEAQPVSLSKYILREDLSGIIAEFKRRSPSRGVMNAYARAGEVCLGYMQAGASALSVLTDEPWFGGSAQDLIEARKINYCPILRKDFIIDSYQVIESRSIGADAILLIADVLEEKELSELSLLASELQMEVLFEAHSPEAIKKLPADTRIVGINSRNLDSFETSLEHAARMAELIPQGVIRIAESGIQSVDDCLRMKKAGYQGFLIGERFMREPDPARSCSMFISKLKSFDHDC